MHVRTPSPQRSPRARAPLRRAAWLSALALGLVAGRPAAAAEPNACAIVSALDKLSDREREALRVACERGPIPDQESLISAIFDTVSRGAWRGPVLARVLTPMIGGSRSVLLRRAPDGDLESALQRVQRGLAVNLTRPAAPRPVPRVRRDDRTRGEVSGQSCDELRFAIEDFDAGTQMGEDTASPFLHDDPALADCLGIPAAELLRVRLVVLRADNIEELFVAAATPDLAYIARFHPDDALVLGRRRLFVVAVPPGAQMVAAARLTNTEVPASWHGLVSHDRIAWAEPPPMTCINLDVRLGPTTTVFVDGVPVPRDELGVSRVLAVTRQEHEVVGLECPKERDCHVRYRNLLPAAALLRHENQCLGVQLDIAPRARPMVAVLDATQGESCREAPLRADGLREAAAEHLKLGTSRGRHDFNDLDAFAAATGALSALRTRLNPEAGETTGPDRGADGTDLLGTAAKEAWRQGIDVLLSFQLQCVRRDAGWDYRLTATRINLSSMFERGRFGSESLDLAGFIEKVAEEFRAVDRLPVALINVIDRSLDVPYLRLYHEQPSAPYRAGADLTIHSYSGRREGVVVVARRLNLGGARPEICRHLPQRTEARSLGLLADEEQRKFLNRAAIRHFAASRTREQVAVFRDSTRFDPLARADRAHVRGSTPGWYLVLARWPGQEQPEDATCIQLTVPSREVWGDVTMSVGSLHLAPKPTPDRFYTRARVGYMRYRRPSLGLGVVVGYAHTSYAWTDGRPAWQDLGTAAPGALEWQRHALLVGGAIEARTRFAGLPFDLRLRATPTLSVGFLRLGKIPKELASFRADNRGSVDVDLDLHFDAIIGYRLGKVEIQHLLLFGLHALDDRIRRPPNDVRDSGGFFLGFGLGIGGVP